MSSIGYEKVVVGFVDLLDSCMAAEMYVATGKFTLERMQEMQEEQINAFLDSQKEREESSDEAIEVARDMIMAAMRAYFNSEHRAPLKDSEYYETRKPHKEVIEALSDLMLGLEDSVDKIDESELPDLNNVLGEDNDGSGNSDTD